MRLARAIEQQIREVLFNDDFTCAMLEPKRQLRACLGLEHGYRHVTPQLRYAQASRHRMCQPSPAVIHIVSCHGHGRAVAARRERCGELARRMATCQARGTRLGARPAWHLALPTEPSHARTQDSV